MKMNMKTTILTIVALLIVMALLAAGSLAWFYAGDNVNMSPAESQGKGTIKNVAANYFNGGDGTENDPFQIATPLQMYNFAWLQYMGFFNQVDGNGNIVQTYFVLTADIDMTGYTLPPIGTVTNPFLGNFNGDYHKIINLKVDNEISADGITDFPGMIEDNTAFQENGTVDIVGMFGVVGSIGETDYTYDSSANVIQNLYVDSITVKTKTDQSLIGIVAGYVNGTVQNVGVIGNTTINIATTTPLSYTNNMSDFSLVGYCTQAYKSQSNTVTLNGSLDDSGSGGSGSGSGIGWGGSLSMVDLYTRINNINTEVGSDNAPLPSNPTYVSTKSYVKTETRTYTSSNTFTSTLEWVSTTKQARTKWYNAGGSYYIDSSSTFLYLCGYRGAANSNYTKTIVSVKDNDTTSTTETPVRSGTLCYFPINVSSSNYSDVLDTNTGYFIGRGESYYGDLRLNKFNMSTISNALTSGTSYTYTADAEGNVTTDNLKVLTWDKEKSAFALISDSFNEAGTNGVTGLVRYNNARQQLANTLKGQTTITGMEFYGKASEYYITAPIVSINGTTYYDYEMPESCIDFQVQSPGYISFFAGAVYSAGSNKYFFSLHEIKRNADNTISSIKQIQEIYTYPGKSNYVYKYSDGTYSETVDDANQLVLAFDLDWIMTSPSTAQAIYYFEIPVNKGEYALGSSGSSIYDGSCALLYLDIGANGDEGGSGSGGDSGTTETIMSATVKQIIYPYGVDFLAGTDTDWNGIDNSAAIRLPSGTTGDTTFKREDNIITVTSDTPAENEPAPEAGYIKDRVTVKIGDNEATAIPIEETVFLKKVAQTTDDGVTTVTITKGSSAGNETDTVLIYSYTAGTATVSFSSDLTMPDDTSTWKYDLTITSTASIVVTVTELGDSGFDITINGKAITAPTTITVPSS